MATAARGQIKSLKVRGLLSFGEETTFEFGKLNLLVGPNGSGKSNLLEILRIFKNCPTDVQQTFADGGFGEWRYRGLTLEDISLAELTSSDHFGSPLRHEIELRISHREAVWVQEVVDSGPEDSHRIKRVYFTHEWKSETDADFNPFENIAIAEQNASTGTAVLRHVSSDTYDTSQSVLAQIRDGTRYYSILSLARSYAAFGIYADWTSGRRSLLRESTPTDRTDPHLSESMDDLPLALNALQGTEAHDTIRGYLRELKPTYADYVTRVAFGRVGLELREAPFDKPLPAKRLSDGTLRFLALAAILLNPDPSPLICIEEPELGMHPDMIRMVANMIVDAAQRTQLIITTHSEHLLTALQDDFDVLFAFDVGDHGSIVRPFRREDFKAWREDHSLGSLWTAGELGGNRW